MMKKPLLKGKDNKTSAEKHKMSSYEMSQSGEKGIDSDKLTQEVPEEFRDPLSNTLEQQKNTSNWSAPENRSDDLINETDPLIEQQELNTQVPPELIQERAFQLYEQRAGNESDSLADWFEAERQLREETKRKN